MIELLDKRGYNRKVYVLDSAHKLYRMRVSHVHYKDSLGLYQEVDTRLSFGNGLWSHDKASYHVNVPEYADGQFEFENAFQNTNHTILAIPQSAHSKGQLRQEGEPGNYILYPDAFGQGIDLEARPIWNGIRKHIVIWNKPNPVRDLAFEFEIVLPANARVVDESGREWNRSSEYSFKDKRVRIGDDKFSYFRDAMVWDATGKAIPVDIFLYAKDGKTYLRKTLPAAYLDKAQYPVTTDHPTAYYSGAGDGYVEGWDTSFSGCRNLTDGSTADYTGQTASCKTEHDTFDEYYIDRLFVPIDTSGIADGDTVDSATLYYWPTAKVDPNDAYSYLVIVQTTQPSPTALTTADFDLCGAITNPTAGAANIDLTGVSTGAYNSIALNATGLPWVSKTTYTKLGIREGHDTTGNDPGALNAPGITMQTSEYTGTSRDPYLDVVTSTPGGAFVPKVIVF